MCIRDRPTKDLPWAHVMHSVSNPSMQGLGHSPSFLVEGSWVVGFFRDAIEKQQPIIIGSLPGIPDKSADYKYGFNDPRSPFSEQPEYAGTPTYGPYPVNKFDYKIPSGHGLGEPDTNRLARNDANNTHGVISSKNGSRSFGIPTALMDPAGKHWETTYVYDEPPSAYAAVYPNNHVFATQSGHIKEFDDTTHNERIHEYHKSGTFYEIDKAGIKTERIVANNYTITIL